jgi:hypothetical protein
MPRSLTEKQKQFATQIAMGAGKTAAYRTAYKPADERAPSVYSNAKRLAKHPGVAAEAAQLRLRYMPAEGTMEALYQHALATMVDLTNSDDSRTRYAAAAWLYQEAKEHRKLVASTPAGNASGRALEALRALYKNIQEPNEGTEPIAWDASDEHAAMDSGAGKALAPEEEHVAHESVPQLTTADEGRALAAPANGLVFKTVSVPGRFPPQFRKVSV